MRLDHTIATHFAADELATLAAELGLEANERDAAPADLATALAARGRAADLLSALGARAPDVDWAALEWPPVALAALHDALDRRLDADGLRDLCLRLGVDPDNLPGETKRARARELVRAMARVGRIEELGFEGGGLGVTSRKRQATSDERRVTRQERRVSHTAPPVARPASEDADSARATRHSPLVTRRSTLVTLLFLLAALLFWRVWAAVGVAQDSYPVPPATGHSPQALAVAVAEFAETADCRRGPAGREASALVYETLARELAAAGLSRRVELTRAGRVCNTADAVAAGQEAGAAVVLWGWLPQTTEGLFAEFTLVAAAAPVSADLARSFEALFTGPDEALSLRLSGRAVVLSRFLLGVLHAAQGDHAAAEALLSAAVTAVEEEMTAGGAAGTAELRRTLAVLLTERGKARAALGRAGEARADFGAAERLNPDYLRLLVARAAEAYNRRDWTAARSYLDRAALQDEPLPTIAYGYGLLDYYDGQFAAAVAHFDRALALSAGQPDAGSAAVYRLARGYSYVALGDCGAAAADFVAAADDPAAPVVVVAAAMEAECGGGEPGVKDPLPSPLPEGEGADRLAEGQGAVGVGGQPPVADPRLSPQEMAAAALPNATPTPGSDACAATSPLPCTPALLPPCASCAATPTPGPLLLEVGARGANVRRGPGAEYAVMATRRAGAQLEVLAANVSGEWFQVRVPGQGRGWVAAAYVTALGEVGALSIASSERGATSAADGPATASRTATATVAWPGAAPATATPTPLWTPPGSATATAPAPPAAPLPTLTPPAPLMPTATLLPPPTARAGRP